MATPPTTPEPVYTDRRATEQSAILMLITELGADVKRLSEKVDGFDAKLTKHMHEETQELATAMTKMMVEAFPEGDGSGHRRHHEAVIRAAEDKADFWRAMMKEGGKWGLIALAVWIGSLIWTGILLGPHK